MKKYIFTLVAVLSLTLTSVVFAHSTVSPSQTATSKYETFTLSVPTEKEVPTVGIRLLVPDGVDRVTPFVKPGWKINVGKDGDKVTQIEWTGGAVPAGQKDIFQFTARTSATDTTLIWKVYQTYQGGEVVAWDQAPGDDVETPYSKTEVKVDTSSTTEKKSKLDLPITLSIVALVFSIIAMSVARKHNHH